jgi:hypothetical protein
MKNFVVVALAVVGVVALPATAGAVTVQTFTTSQNMFDEGVRNQGWWSPTFANSDDNDNYVVGGGAVIGRPEVTVRNFFTFDLSSACAAGAVELRLTRFDQFQSETFALFDVSTPTATLNNNAGTSQAIFDDLGSGTGFGSFPVPDGRASDVLRFPLNAAGVGAFNAARGGFFSIGGSIPNAAPTSHIFGASQGAGTQQLVVTCLPNRPMSKSDCKNGGWQTFGVFKNQGDCVSFVATGGKNPPASSP